MYSSGKGIQNFGLYITRKGLLGNKHSKLADSVSNWSLKTGSEVLNWIQLAWSPVRYFVETRLYVFVDMHRADAS
jgi:hypothetical protein